VNGFRSILAGGKLSGEYDDFGIGALSDHDDKTLTTGPSNALGRAHTPPIRFLGVKSHHLDEWRPTGRTEKLRGRRRAQFWIPI